MTADNSASFLSRLAVKEEATKGVAQTSPDQYLYFTDDPTINPVQNTIKNEVIQSRDLVCVTPGSYHVEGSLPVFVTPENMGWFFKWAMGDVTSTQQGATAAYLHEYVPADFLKSFTTWVKRGENQEVKIPYCVVEGITLEQTPDDSLRGTVNIIGQQETITSDYGSEDFGTVCPFGNADLNITIGGSATGQAAEVHNTSFSLENGYGVDEGKVHGSRFYKDLVPSARTITGSFDMYFNDDSEMQMFWGNSTATGPQDTLESQEIIMDWVSPVLADTGYYYELTVTVPAAHYETTSVNIGGERVIQNVQFVAKYDATATNAVSIDLTNLVTDYTL